MQISLKTGSVCCCLLALALLLQTARPARAGVMPPSNICTSPLLHVKFVLPEGGHVTFYPVPGYTREYPAPVVAGFRPGYVYRVMLSGLPVRPEMPLYPTLEVIGTLSLPQVVPAADHPAPVVLTRADLERIHSGVLVSKVIYLEDPDLAVATATRSDNPIENQVEPGEDPIEMARLRGRPVLIVRIGERQLGDDELHGQSVPGTILLPKQKGLLPPALPPFIPWKCVPVVDPLWGPKHPHEECLHDGGDSHIKVGFDRNGQIGGLDPTDTVARYTNFQGRDRLSVSNRVCICVPRFMVMRCEVRALGFDMAINPYEADTVQAQNMLANRVPPHETNQREYLEAMRSRMRPSSNVMANGPEQIAVLAFLRATEMNIGPAEVIGDQEWRELTNEQRTKVVKQLEFVREFIEIAGVRQVETLQLGPQAVGIVKGVKAHFQVQEVHDLTSSPCEPPRVPEQPLYLYKWADRHSGQIGDIVTFYIKYTNHGGQPIGNVAVSDSLTGRLEYIPGSAKSDRDAVFTSRPNQAGSAILQWEVAGQLLPGAKGVVSFQAKIR